MLDNGKGYIIFVDKNYNLAGILQELNDDDDANSM